MNYLITPSLLNSAAWYLSIMDEDKQEAERQKFIATLEKYPFAKTPAMIYGINFEDDVCRVAKAKLEAEDISAEIPEISDAPINTRFSIIKEIAAIVRGGTWQLPCKKLYKNFLLYGRMDVVKGNTIYDIKTASRYDVGKFHERAQHRLYLYCTGLERCEYLVAEVYHGAKETSVKGFSRESYTDRDIEPMVDDFINWLEYDKELKDLYYANWKSKY